MKTPILALALLVAAALAQAETVAPAAAAPATQPAAARANAEHPAVLAARQARSAGIDANRFIVLPPASARWTSGPAVDANAVRTADASAR
ncbi:hypothetical protein [Azohydromonas caseinilytica]|uniref:Uncharacterized protein n=1 Tax=Azohydromonas caseinilytica TaxID=2728836 RepID=A0A848F5T4_9BURK|nr:hypothetical protein [Azohydromonas caseinilytica]NML14762.1 hypothetical protein [Azohydromonas caseinilytica]